MPTPVQPTGNAYYDGLLWGWKWDSTNLTVSFPSTLNAYQGYDFVQNFQPFTEFQAQQIINFGLNNLGVFSNLSFSPAFNDFGNLRFAQADQIAYGAQHITPQLHIPGGRGSAEANPPDPVWNPDYTQGDNWFTNGAYQQPVLGSFQYAAGLLHEVGHSLGLKHGHAAQPWSYNGRDSQTLVFPALPADADSQEFSVMTYRSHIGADLSQGASGQEEYPWTYMIADIAVLQYLYGANFGAGSNEDDSVYQFDPQTGAMSVNGFSFGASYNAKILLTIWDGGGHDHYDFSNYGADQRVSLRPGEFSNFSPAQLSNLSLGKGEVNLARGNVANPALFQGDLRSLIEDASTGAGSDFVVGNEIANRLISSAGNDTVLGEGGNDTLYLGLGDDVGGGGAGNDLIHDGAGANTIYGGFGSDTVHGGTGNDTIYGGGDGNDQNRLYGNDGNDLIFTGGGGDLVEGGAGNDIIRGDAGNDTLFGGLGDNNVGGGAGNDLIRMADGNDTVYGGLGNDDIAGGGGNDQIFGSAGNNVIYGGFGNDTVQGGSGEDTIFGGGSGANQLLGNGGNDQVFGGTGNDFIGGGSGNDKLLGSAGDDMIFAGTGDDLVGGGAGNDAIMAGAGNNQIYGGEGNDTITAGLGRDLINGGPGADVFDFDSAARIGIGTGRDVIDDFTSGVDKIDLVALGAQINGASGLIGNGISSFYYFAGGGLLIGDVNGDSIVDWVLQLGGAPSVVEGDFIL